MCHITKVLQGFNSECNFINPVQKGFKAGLMVFQNIFQQLTN